MNLQRCLPVLMLIGFLTLFSCYNHNERRCVTMQINTIPFTAQFEIVGNKLKVSYKLENKTEGDIYVFNNLFKWDRFGNQMRDANLVYVFHTDDNFIHLSKRVLPVPSDRDVPIREVPFATKVNAKGILEKSILVDLPVTEYNPYYLEKKNSKYKEIVCEGAFLSIGFVCSYDGLEAIPLPDAPEVFRIHGQYLFQKTELVVSEKQYIRLELRKRTDKFERF